MQFSRKMYDWLAGKARDSWADWWLAVPFMLETIVFIPLDPLLALFCLEHKERSWRYALVATMASMAGAAVAYVLGALMWDSIGARFVNLFVSSSLFNQALASYRQHQFAAVLVGSFIPIPFKVITLSAGFCKLAFIPFIFCAGIARGARFFLVAGATYLWGHHLKQFIDRHAHHVIPLIGLKIALVVGALWWLRH